MQVELSKPEGVRRLRETSRRHLEVAIRDVGAGEFMGVALAGWCDAVDRYWQQILDHPPLKHSAGNYPYLRPGGFDDKS